MLFIVVQYPYHKNYRRVAGCFLTRTWECSVDALSSEGLRDGIGGGEP